MKIKKHLWKFGLVTLAIAIPAVALTSCGSASPSKTFAELVVSDDTSTLRDKSFSESSYNGWYNFMNNKNILNPDGNPDNYDKEVLEIPEINSGSSDLNLAKGYWRRPSSNRENTFRQIFNGGANLIIAPGFNHAEAIEKVAAEPNFKDKGFILLDSGVNSSKGDYTNVASFTFRAEQSGFLAGIATAEFLNANADVFTDSTKGDDGKLKVGGFVGQAFPSTTDFLAGFQHGIIAYNIKATTDNSTQKNSASKKQLVEWVDLGPDISNYASGDFSAGGGVQKSKEIIVDKGADAIIPIAGPQTADAISVITSGSRPAIVIGVDSEQENIAQLQKQFTSKQLGDKKLKGADGKELAQQNILQFSAVKKLEEAVYRTLSAIFNETDPNNATKTAENDQRRPVKGFGYNNIGTLENETVGVSKAGEPWVKKFNSNWFDINGDFDPNGQDPTTEAVTPSSSTETDASTDTTEKRDSVYENAAYKNLESKGLLYTDISGITSDSSFESNSAKVVKSKVIEGDTTNKVLTTILSATNNPDATLNKQSSSTSLNGSIWSLQKGKLKSDLEAVKNQSTEPKRYTI